VCVYHEINDTYVTVRAHCTHTRNNVPVILSCYVMVRTFNMSSLVVFIIDLSFTDLPRFWILLSLWTARRTSLSPPAQQHMHLTSHRCLLLVCGIVHAPSLGSGCLDETSAVLESRQHLLIHLSLSARLSFVGYYTEGFSCRVLSRMTLAFV